MPNPGVFVTCGEKEFLDDKKNTILNPIIIIEVLSPSIEDYDRGKKFMLYRSIPTLQDYILIDSFTCHIEKFSKNETGNWVLTEIKDINGQLTIENLHLNLPVHDIFADVELN